MSSIEKIKSLGFESLGIVGPVDERRIQDLQTRRKVKLPQDYIRLIKTIGYFRFNQSVMAKGIEKVPHVSIDDNMIPVGRFFTWGEGHFSINDMLETYLPQIPDTFIPFADGLSGDLIGFWCFGENEYAVSYWSHEGIIGNDTFDIAKTFEGFIDSLKWHEVKLV